MATVDLSVEPQTRSRLPLVGIDGNAFGVMGTVQRGLREAGADPTYVSEVMAAMQGAGGYEALLAIAVQYTTNGGLGGVEGEDPPSDEDEDEDAIYVAVDDDED
jgi:hypothetical protein